MYGASTKAQTFPDTHDVVMMAMVIGVCVQLIRLL
jgi:hypothetical protein